MPVPVLRQAVDVNPFVVVLLRTMLRPVVEKQDGLHHLLVNVLEMLRNAMIVKATYVDYVFHNHNKKDLDQTAEVFLFI